MRPERKVIWMAKTAELSKTVLAFDIDHTLSLSKQPIPDEVAELLTGLLEEFEVCVISGRSYEQFMVQVVGRLPNPSAESLGHLHLLPAQGTQYYRFREGWQQEYAYRLHEEDVMKIFAVVEEVARMLGYWRAENREMGDMILENRESQVTFAAVDTNADVGIKRAWDPDCAKRNQMIAKLKELAPEFEYKLGGNTSIDITLPGMDKAYGMRRLMETLEIDKDEILYFGDMTQPGGNDYPVVQMGIDTITVREYHDTIYALKGILSILA